MNASTPTLDALRQFGTTLKTHWWLWAVPGAAATLLAIAYLAMRTPTWEASQALVVRDEALAAVNRQGRFDTPEAMKTTQETVLEIARNPTVVAAALKRVGPPENASPDWPSDRDVEDFRDQILVKAPRGAEFGRTEMIYLTVRCEDRQRAVRLAEAICRELDEFWKGLRNAKAESMTQELARTATAAEADLEQTTGRLEAMEKELGGDLVELRNMTVQGTGDGNLRLATNKIDEELRQARATDEVLLEQQSLLQSAERNPDQLVATPSRLLESQPALRRLKDGLVDAQLRKAELLGKMQPDHPNVLHAIQAEAQVRKDLHAELQVALRGVNADLKVSQTHIRSLETQLADVRTRLERLAGLRARYENLVIEVKRNTEIVEKARKALADARASQGAAQSSSLITRVDGPAVGSRPVGASAAIILLAGLLGGHAAGIGLVFLVSPMTGGRGRRWTDYLFGRRAGDRNPPGRRATDAPSTPPAVAPTDERRGGGDRRARRTQ